MARKNIVVLSLGGSVGKTMIASHLFSPSMDSNVAATAELVRPAGMSDEAWSEMKAKNSAANAN